MRIGVPKEIKAGECRVGLTPQSVAQAVVRGHQVFVERRAGMGAGFRDEQYENQGARLVATADQLFEASQLIVKVKEPLAIERARLRSHHTLFTYLHLAADPEQAHDLLHSGATAIAYESVTDQSGRRPLLTPMSRVAGRMSVQAGARGLEASTGGRGMLLGGIPGASAARVVVIGGGVVGRNAAEMAVRFGARVTVLDRDRKVLASLVERFGPAVNALYSDPSNLEESVVGADLVIGAVLLPNARAPRLITAAMVRKMRPGAVIVDVAIDQGGCAETSRPTTHADPTYIVNGVVHYCVTNMPGAVPRTSTQALNDATLPYVLELASRRPTEAIRSDPGLQDGLTVRRGQITQPEVAEALDLPYIKPLDTLD